MTTVMRFSFFFSTMDKITASLFLLNQCCDSPIFKIKFLKNEQLWCITISQINRIFRIFLLGSSPSLARTISGADLNDWGFYDVFFHSTTPQPDDTIAAGVLSRAVPFDMRAALLLLLVGKQSRPKRRRDDSARTFAAQLYVPLDLLEYKPDGGHTCLLACCCCSVQFGIITIYDQSQYSWKSDGRPL